MTEYNRAARALSALEAGRANAQKLLREEPFSQTARGYLLGWTHAQQIADIYLRESK